MDEADDVDEGRGSVGGNDEGDSRDAAGVGGSGGGAVSGRGVEVRGFGAVVVADVVGSGVGGVGGDGDGDSDGDGDGGAGGVVDVDVVIVEVVGSVTSAEAVAATAEVAAKLGE